MDCILGRLWCRRHSFYHFLFLFPNRAASSVARRLPPFLLAFHHVSSVQPVRFFPEILGLNGKVPVFGGPFPPITLSGQPSQDEQPFFSGRRNG